MRFYPRPFSMDETVAWIERMRARYEEVGFALLALDDRETGEFLGNVGPLVQDVDGAREVELGWYMTPRRARRGIAREAGIVCRDWVFAEVRPGYVISLILPDNTPSSGVSRKLGMTVWKQVMSGSLQPKVHDV